MTLYYLREMDRYRVWRGDWAHDMFEIISQDTFVLLQNLGIVLIERLNN